MSKIDEMVREGLAHHQAGRRDSARGLYLKALARQPSHPAANHLLGLLFLQQGEANEAVKHLQRAVRGNRSAEYLGNLGTALNAAGRHGEALDSFDAALALQPKSPGVLNNRGMALKALGRHDDAIDSYRRAIALAPGDATLQRNLGNALAAIGYVNEAIAAYRDALRLRPDFGNAAIGLGNGLITLGRQNEARMVTLELAERFPANAEMQRAAAHAARLAGDPAGAAAAYRRAIAADPRDVEAHRMLGLMVTRTDANDPEITAIRHLIDLPDVAPRDRAQLAFALGQACEDLGDGDEAYAWFSRANGWLREAAPHDVETDSIRLDRIKQSFAALSDADLPPLGQPVGPIFIVGLPRSGKSTLEAMLSRHPALMAAGELGVLRNLAIQQRRAATEIVGAALRRAEAESLLARWRDVVGRMFGAARVIDTTPSNRELVGLVRLGLPEARILFCHRETSSHAAALFTKYFAQGGHEATASLDDCLRAVIDVTELGRFWAERFPGAVHTIDTGRLRADPSEIESVLSFLGLPTHPDCARPVETEPRLDADRARTTTGRTRLAAEIDRLHRA